MSGFRSSVWDPLLIVSQIVCVQCLFWVTLGGWVYTVDFIGGASLSLDQMFDYRKMKFQEFHGKLLLSAFLCNSLTGGLAMWYVVRRSKQCWDFATTAHVFHMIAVICYRGLLPHSAAWWLVTVLSAVIMTVLGEFLCMRTEMAAIPLSMQAAQQSPKADL